jgi:hypothetical protein
MPNKRTLTEKFLKKLKPQPRKFLVWDTKQRGLAVLVQPTSMKSWKCIYSLHGRVRWYHIGAVDAFGLDKARKTAARVMYEVSEGKDPAAERKADRIEGTFEELVTRYFDEYAKKQCLHKCASPSTAPTNVPTLSTAMGRCSARNKAG